MGEHYVYVYLDPRKPGEYVYGDYKFDYEPFYVGMGKDQRMFYHLTRSDRNKIKSNKISKIISEGFSPIIRQYRNCLTVDEAEVLEIDMIDIIGRLMLDSGPLTNIRPGGRGERIYESTSEEQRIKISESNKRFWRENTVMKAARNEKIAATKKRLYDEGMDSPFKGKKHSDEAKRKTSEKIKALEVKPNAGNRWVIDPNNEFVLKIKAEELDYYLSLGYTKGRKLKLK